MTTKVHDQQTQWNSANRTFTNGDSTANTNGEQHPIEDRYNTHDASFRRHYQLNYHDNAHTYDDFYAPAYRFGFELGEESAAAAWDDVKAEAQRHWQTNHTSDWNEVADAVHYGWKEQRDPEALRVHHYGEFEDYRTGFESHYLNTVEAPESSFEHYEPAYRYGYDIAVDPAYNTQLWPEVEPAVRKYYETEYAEGQLPWEDYREAVHHAWHGVRTTPMS